MSDTYYFKTQNPEIFNAVDAYFKEKKALSNACHALKNHFGAKAVLFRSSIPTMGFGGLVFNPTKDDESWTKPDKNGVQFPRPIKSIKKAGKPAHQKLLDEWNELKPPKIDMSNAIKSMGLNWGDFIFGGSLLFFAYHEHVYIKTNKKPTQALTEILASEFYAEEALYDGANHDH